MKSVYSAVRAGSLNKAFCASALKGSGISNIPSNWFAGVDIWIIIKTDCIYVILCCTERSELDKSTENRISYRTGEYVRRLLMMAVIIYSEESCLF